MLLMALHAYDPCTRLAVAAAVAVPAAPEVALIPRLAALLSVLLLVVTYGSGGCRNTKNSILAGGVAVR
jgi:hypothetical protein